MLARDNPFRTERTEALTYRAPGFAWEALLARLASLGGRGAIRGPQGSGKTTLLRELGERLASAGFSVRRIRPDLDDRRLARDELRALPEGAGPKMALLLDGADRVGTLAWLRLLHSSRAAGVLVITSHRSGRLPTLHRCATSVRLLEDLTTELAAAEALDSVSLPELFSREQGNLRTVFRALFDRYAER